VKVTVTGDRKAEPTRSHWIQVNGSRMHARLGGWHTNSGVVVLVHGLGVSSRYMVPTLKALAPHVRVAAPDLPGFGRSDKPRHVLNIEQLADALAHWMSVMGIQSATLVGNSVGCQIAVDVAVRHPSRADRLVLVGPTLEPALRTPLRALWRLAVDTFREAPSQPFLVAVDYLVAGPRRIAQTFRHAAADPLESKLPRVQTPTLVVRGERDPIASQGWVESIARRIPDAETMVVPGAAHTVNYMAPETLARAVLAFMARR
jgi:2-hydroxy-6-oxonona-2,4-dienedioate hydrolase